MVEHKWIKTALLGFKKVMDKHKIKFWLEYGTQLGAVRDGKIISWDMDGDVGIWISDLQRMKDAEADFRANDMYIAFQPDHAYLNYMVDRDKGIFRAVVDIYTFDVREHKGKKWVVRIENGEVFDVRSPFEYYKNIRVIKFLGKYFDIPGKAEEALEFAYGEGWKTPIQKAGVSIIIGPKAPRLLNLNGRTHHKKLEDL